MKPLYSINQLRKIEEKFQSHNLMEKAGKASAEIIQVILGMGNFSILIISGEGNNGGDGFVAAKYLNEMNYDVKVLLAGNAENLKGDALDAYKKWRDLGGVVLKEMPRESNWDLVVDALFGIGLNRDVSGEAARIINQLNQLNLPIVSLDVPSGLNADTGNVFGLAVNATYTISFIGNKPGFYTLDGPDITGKVFLSDLGLQVEEYKSGYLVDDVPCLPRRRPMNSHKGLNGSTFVIGGDENMIGAALLSSRAALLIGSGKVYCCFISKNFPDVDLFQPELMILKPEAIIQDLCSGTVIIGPGMGMSGKSKSYLKAILNSNNELIIDADALNILSEDKALQVLLSSRSSSSVLTPHPGEAARLLGCTNKEIQSNRIESAINIARKYRCITVLKGCGSIIATPDGHWFINSTGNPGLSAAGMGDVLSGLIGGMAAQGMSLLDATLLGVYLHGEASETIASKLGVFGITASEVMAESRSRLNFYMN